MADSSSYSRIVNSSLVIGGSQSVVMFFGFVRVKFAAILIGASGIGLISAYQSIIDLFGGIFGLGLKNSSIREIASAFAAKDEQKLSRTVMSLRRTSLLSGILGSFVIILFSRGLSMLTFGSHEYAFEILFIGLAIIFNTLFDAETGMLQGMRQIRLLAKVQITAGIFGSIVSIFFYFLMGIQSAVFAVVSLVFIRMVVGFWFSRQIKFCPVDMSWRDSLREAGGMIRLGLVFMWSAILTTGVAYATRALIGHEFDLVAIGIFSAAYALSGVLVNFILSAMSGDYYPSLTAVSKDKAKMQALVNQQTEIGLLLVLPGMLGLLVFSPLLIEIFYSADFLQAEFLIRWFVLGCLFKIIYWPLSFIMMAIGATYLLVFTQTVFNILHLLTIWTLLLFIGVEGTAIAFFLLCAFQVLMVYIVARHLISFRWSKDAKKVIFLSICAILTVLTSTFLLPNLWLMISGGAFIVIIGLMCFRTLVSRLGVDHTISNKLKSIPLIKIVFR